MIAAMFLFVFMIEMGSHMLIDSQDPNAVTEVGVCEISEKIPDRVDCPEQRRQRQETKNILDEMTTHVVVLNSLTVPHAGRMYDTGSNYASTLGDISRSLTPPFRPPKQS